MISAILSDLFFNHEHPNRDALFANYRGQKDSPTTEQVYGAALRDANEFHAYYSQIIAIEFSPDDLADDFMRRI